MLQSLLYARRWYCCIFHFVLSLVLVILAARLLADLTSLRLVPVFRVYLFALIVGMLTRGDYTHAWVGLAVLLIKCGATAEMCRALYRKEGELEIRYLWGYAISAGLLFAGLIFLFGLEPQWSLVNPVSVYVRQLAQVCLAAIALSMTVFSWAFHRNTGFIAAHSWLMTALWIDYAAIGLTTPATGTEWRRLDAIWASLAILTMAGWIVTVSPTLRAAWRSGWGRIVDLFSLRRWLFLGTLLIVLRWLRGGLSF